MSLTGKKPGASYKDLLQIDNSNAGVDGTLRNVKGGAGTATPLQVSSSAVAVTSTPTNDSDVATKEYVDTKGGMSFIASANLTSGSSVDLEDASFSDYSRLNFIYYNLNTTTDNQQIELQLKVNGTWQTGNVYTAAGMVYPFSSTITYIGANPSSKETGIELTQVGYVSNTQAYPNSLDLTFNHGAHFATGMGTGGGITDNAYSYVTTLHCVCHVVGEIEGFRLTTSGTFQNGTMKVYGII